MVRCDNLHLQRTFKKARGVGRGQATERHDFGLPPVRAALQFPAGASAVTLGSLVDELARLSGQELAMQPEVRQQLDQLREPLELATPVPVPEEYAYVEGMLAVQGRRLRRQHGETRARRDAAGRDRARRDRGPGRSPGAPLPGHAPLREHRLAPAPRRSSFSWIRAESGSACPRATEGC
jgi:hypothetical protein